MGTHQKHSKSLSDTNGLFHAGVSAYILNGKNELLLTQRNLKSDHHPGAWEPLSGRLKQGESFEDGLVREIKEEAGIDIKIISPISTFHFFRSKEKVEYIGVAFACRLKSGQVAVDGVEQIAFEWVSLEKALKIVKDENMINNIKLLTKLLTFLDD